MSRHVDAIKSMVFDEPDFDSDDEIKSKATRRKSKKELEEKHQPSVETIVFRDPAKKRKKLNVS